MLAQVALEPVGLGFSGPAHPRLDEAQSQHNPGRRSLPNAAHVGRTDGGGAEVVVDVVVWLVGQRSGASIGRGAFAVDGVEEENLLV